MGRHIATLSFLAATLAATFAPTAAHAGWAEWDTCWMDDSAGQAWDQSWDQQEQSLENYASSSCLGQNAQLVSFSVSNEIGLFDQTASSRPEPVEICAGDPSPQGALPNLVPEYECRANSTDYYAPQPYVEDLPLCLGVGCPDTGSLTNPSPYDSPYGGLEQNPDYHDNRCTELICL